MFKFIYRIFSKDKINFLDEILEELESNPIIRNEDEIAPKLCFYDEKFAKRSKDTFRNTRKFIPINSERLYFRNAALYLDREKLITVIDGGLHNSCQYLINYEGIILIRNGGLAKKIFLEKFTGILQRLAWFVIFLTFLFNVLLQLKFETSEINTSSSQKPLNIEITKPKQKTIGKQRVLDKVVIDSVSE